MSKYWDINTILPYQRCFNLINGERSIGKTYTTQKFMLKRGLEKSQEFIYLVRTQDEKKQGIFEQAFAKVTNNEFPNTAIKFEIDCCYVEETGHMLGYCIALSECTKIKKRSFPNVYWLLFDEYMLEGGQSVAYVNGWKEPDLFLSIYHTIDREEDRVKCFLLGNNTSFYNPYHMHKAFRIPESVTRGCIWYSENVLFQWAVGSEELKDEKSKSKFVRMLSGTQYGEYAVGGNYTEDIKTLIAERPADARHVFNFTYKDDRFGVWAGRKEGCIYISNKTDPSCLVTLAFDIKDHGENTLLTKDKRNSAVIWLSRNFKLGNVRYETMEIKKKTEAAIQLIL